MIQTIRPCHAKKFAGSVICSVNFINSTNKIGGFMMTTLFTDVSAWNEDSALFFKQLATQNVKAAVVKITEGSADGTNYVNPKAASQITNALNAGLQAHCYHFARFTSVQDAKNEATFFVQHVKAFGMDPTTILVLDVESTDLTTNPQALTDQINAFMTVVKANGYPKCDIYASASWFNQPRFYREKLIPQNCWVANYGRPQPDVETAGAWQFTDHWNDQNLDMSYDFNGFYTN
ncbi:1,4-beta-N-acetylmuramidase [Lactobacillus curvatus]|nr:1,4-beta-N-acetylmuramidase [Latilactobacillus curvatus]MSE24215.1 1,4-beta-N-acetylmuramidase [Latilactobacillus curvatus]